MRNKTQTRQKITEKMCVALIGFPRLGWGLIVWSRTAVGRCVSAWSVFVGLQGERGQGLAAWYGAANSLRNGNRPACRKPGSRPEDSLVLEIHMPRSADGLGAKMAGSRADYLGGQAVRRSRDRSWTIDAITRRWNGICPEGPSIRHAWLTIFRRRNRRTVNGVEE